MAVEKKRSPIVKDFVEPQEPITKKDNYYLIEGIPTKYRLYPEGTQIYGRPLTVKEVRFLASMTDSNYQFVINEILKNTIKGIDIQELYVADKVFILFWLRANTYKNEGYSTEFTCRHCGRSNHYLFTMDKLRVEYLKDDFVANDDFKLLTTDDVLRISFPKVRDENKVSQILKNKTSVEYDEDILSVAAMVKSINGTEYNTKYVYDYLLSLNPEDYAYLETYISDNEIGVSPVVSTNCQYEDCGEESLIEVRFQSDFFLPKYKSR